MRDGADTPERIFDGERGRAAVFAVGDNIKNTKKPGGGPIYKKLGNKVLYARNELERFLGRSFTSCEDTFFTAKAGRHDDY